jgi:hypothetical protein
MSFFVFIPSTTSFFWTTTLADGVAFEQRCVHFFVGRFLIVPGSSWLRLVLESHRVPRQYLAGLRPPDEARLKEARASRLTANGAVVWLEIRPAAW